MFMANYDFCQEINAKRGWFVPGPGREFGSKFAENLDFR